jgi:hypothetical protein
LNGRTITVSRYVDHGMAADQILRNVDELPTAGQAIAYDRGIRALNRDLKHRPVVTFSNLEHAQIIEQVLGNHRSMKSVFRPTARGVKTDALQRCLVQFAGGFAIVELDAFESRLQLAHLRS